MDNALKFPLYVIFVKIFLKSVCIKTLFLSYDHGLMPCLVDHPVVFLKVLTLFYLLLIVSLKLFHISNQFKIIEHIKMRA